VKGGPEAVVAALKQAGIEVTAATPEEIASLASKMKNVGRVQSAFKIGGRILLPIAVTKDAVRWYYAQNKTRETASIAGGWTGSVAAGSAFGAWFAPADVAGPWAWGAHAVGTLVVGAGGYFVGSSVAEATYDWSVTEVR
jgi:hypothetical protein